MRLQCRLAKEIVFTPIQKRRLATADQCSDQKSYHTGEGRCPWQNWVPACEAVIQLRNLARLSSYAIGVGKGGALPALRTVRAVLPHTALQSLGSSSGVSRLLVGRSKGEEAVSREEGIGPALMVG